MNIYLYCYMAMNEYLSLLLYGYHICESNDILKINLSVRFKNL